MVEKTAQLINEKKIDRNLCTFSDESESNQDGVVVYELKRDAISKCFVT